MMSPVTSQPGRADRGRRRAVRIVRSPRASRTAIASLGLATVAAILLLIVWRSWRTDVVVGTPGGNPPEVEMRWKCDAGHVFFAAGQASSRECWTCGRPAYAVFDYHCKTHGVFEVAVLFSNDASGRRVPSRWRPAGRRWVETQENLRCPRCRHPLVYRRDPLSDYLRRKKEGGG